MASTVGITTLASNVGDAPGEAVTECRPVPSMGSVSSGEAPADTNTDLTAAHLPATPSSEIPWNCPGFPNANPGGISSTGAGSDADADASRIGNAPDDEVAGAGGRFLRLFYENFHVSHPILVPGPLFLSRGYPRVLRRVVDFTGSHYAQTPATAALKSKVAAELKSSTEHSTAMVQARLIYAIVLFSRGDMEEAQDHFRRCTELALKIGMHRGSFASADQPVTSIEAESLRRTWWELYITDIFLSIPLRTISFHCSAVSPEVDLPCEEAVYMRCREVPVPRRILEFKRRVILAEDTAFSSFSYRIEAATIIGRVLVLNRLQNHHGDHLQAAENALVSWSNHLPVEKLDIVDSYGTMDEMMFQAHAFMAYASMLLHLPRSQYYPLLSSAQDPFLPFDHLHSMSSSARLIQTIKTVDASRRISNYISLCPNVQRHTPFIIPALVISGLVQAATATKHSEECFEHHYHRIVLILGCLKVTKRTWLLAEPAYNTVRSRVASLLSNSVDKWSAEPMTKLIALAKSSNEPVTGSGASHSREPEASAGMHANHTSTAAQMSVLFDTEQLNLYDPFCYDFSTFSTFPEL